MLKLPSNEGEMAAPSASVGYCDLLIATRFLYAEISCEARGDSGELVRHPVTGGVKLAHLSVTFANEQPEAALAWCALATRIS
jgi:hypothetical protein